jgi:hypothetical protein
MDTIAHYFTGKKEWDELVGLAATSYNNSVHSSTGYTPFELGPDANSARNPGSKPKSEQLVDQNFN